MSKAKSGLLILQVPEVIITQPLLAIPMLSFKQVTRKRQTHQQDGVILI